MSAWKNFQTQKLKPEHNSAAVFPIENVVIAVWKSAHTHVPAGLLPRDVDNPTGEGHIFQERWKRSLNNFIKNKSDMVLKDWE